MAVKTVQIKDGMVMVEYYLVVKFDEAEYAIRELDDFTGEHGFGIYNAGSNVRTLKSQEVQEVYKMVPHEILEKKGI